LLEVFEKSIFTLSNKEIFVWQLIHKEKQCGKSLLKFYRTAQIVSEIQPRINTDGHGWKTLAESIK